MAKESQIATRFAPSPNGPLHIGHAYAAARAHDFARERGGAFHLRIEDIDGRRTRPELIDAIFEDLAWLGIAWDGEPLFQSQRVDRYRAALERLKDMGLAYPCFCTRRTIAEAIARRPVPHGPDGPVYPGTCRGLSPEEGDRRIAAGEEHCWRIDMTAAAVHAGPLDWTDIERGVRRADPLQFGDVVIERKDAPSSYHLAATLDDAETGMSHVVRGMDLFAYTHVHRLLQALLDLPVPIYLHHPLLLDESGEKLSKSRRSASLAELREKGEDGPALLARLRQSKFPVGISLSEP